MTSMDLSDKPAVRRPETGWSKARRLRGKAALRTCLPAVENRATPGITRSGAEWNIVRGED
ncbi:MULTISPECIES: hypothetical protein [Streptomyces]|uniref:Transposase n=1 Tax=Streptomyces violaceus TaxID=1936 RepID=A0ABY9UMA4_STRVL|nr:MULTISPECIES: hypothetical protein [Streptomyces]WND24039.1 hypothetical protein RI060_02410 [Streptomyces janthinus]WNF68349.1 hypothetical protein RJD14_32185 [Streptomyces sp. CGMCC 4.1456]GGS77403.1 hypothetical protein GCM10010270_56500 [Streptomyces janthinus]